LLELLAEGEKHLHPELHDWFRINPEPHEVPNLAFPQAPLEMEVYQNSAGHYRFILKLAGGQARTIDTKPEPPGSGVLEFRRKETAEQTLSPHRSGTAVDAPAGILDFAKGPKRSEGLQIPNPGGLAATMERAAAAIVAEGSATYADIKGQLKTICETLESRAEQRQAAPWIYTTDAMPEEGQNVICWDGGEDPESVRAAKADDRGNFWVLRDANPQPYHIRGVVAWQPYPAPPTSPGAFNYRRPASKPEAPPVTEEKP
jgi:hypothetical protein